MKKASFFLVFLSISSFASIWTETASAGRLPSTAQRVLGAGNITAIDGFISELTDVDLFLIRIQNPLAFSASTVSDPGFFVDDPQLFLFDANGLGVYMNDEANGSQSELPAGHPLGPQTPGFYYLAIGRFDNEPLSQGGRIFPDVPDTTGPEGPGGLSPLTAWNDDVSGRQDLPSLYSIELTGVVSAIPEPGTLGLLIAGLTVAVAMRIR